VRESRVPLPAEHPPCLGTTSFAGPEQPHAPTLVARSAWPPKYSHVSFTLAVARDAVGPLRRAVGHMTMAVRIRR
jgi:hypothetical protein